jgi:hypothetical protein
MKFGTLCVYFIKQLLFIINHIIKMNNKGL